jgi:diguanylate cyclase (GGDEF)-like protein
MSSANATQQRQADAVPGYLKWVLANTQIGLLLLDAQCRIVMANKWILDRVATPETPLEGQLLTDAFASLKGSHFERTLTKALASGFPSILSQSLHPSPFPLYANVAQRLEGGVMRQSIQIVPMGPRDAQAAGERFTLVQITDVSANVAREGLLKAQTEHMRSVALVDGLTGIGNRRSFDDTLPAELRAAVRGGTPMGLILFDIDHFKLFNDTYGHPAGDVCLKAIASLLPAVARRPRDRVARYGGEELVMVLPDTGLAGTLQMAQEVLNSVQELQISHSSSPTAGVVTVTAGVAVVDPAIAKTSDDLLQNADSALYAAKRNGRNRIWRFDSGTGAPRAFPEE